MRSWGEVGWREDTEYSSQHFSNTCEIEAGFKSVSQAGDKSENSSRGDGTVLWAPA